MDANFVKLKLLLILFLLTASFGGLALGVEHFAASDSLEDEINVVPDPIELLNINYEESLGGDNGEIKVNEWHEFSINLENPDDSENWENVFLRSKFSEIQKENISLEFREGEGWERVDVFDLRLLDLDERGSGFDIGKEKDWTISSNESKTIEMRLKIDEIIENLNLEFRAFSSLSENYEMFSSYKEKKSMKIIEPTNSLYIKTETGTKYEDKKHLEISQGENKEFVTILDFESIELPDNYSQAFLNIHQYWGSNFSTLEKDGSKIELYSISGNLNHENVKNNGTKINKKPILGNEKWYSFDITNFLENRNNLDNFNLLLKLRVEEIKNKNHRIRFYSLNSEKEPIITIS